MNAHVAQWLGRRERQEDAYAVRHFPSGLLAVVCDGMGGHHLGDLAAKTAAATFMDAFAAAGEEMVPAARLRHALASANDAVRAAFTERDSFGGTTLLAAFVTPVALWWVSVGDSLLLLWRHQRLQRLNEDHSMRPVFEKLATSGCLSHRDAMAQGHRLRSAVTGDELTLVDLRTAPYPLLPGDRLVLATDGADNLLQPFCLVESTRALLAERSDSLAACLVEACRAMNEPTADNTTIISVDLP